MKREKFPPSGEFDYQTSPDLSDESVVIDAERIVKESQIEPTHPAVNVTRSDNDISRAIFRGWIGVGLAFASFGNPYVYIAYMRAKKNSDS